MIDFLLVLTATGDFDAIELAKSMAAFMTSSCVSQTLLTKPLCNASSAVKYRAVYASSLAQLSLPTTF